MDEALLYLVKSKKIICIVGYSATGKTYLSNWLEEKLGDAYIYFHSDDFMDHGYEQSLYAMIGAIENALLFSDKKIIIEGVQVYRLLRKWAKDGVFPELILEVVATAADRIERYKARGMETKLPNIDQFDRNLCQIWLDYKLSHNKVPILKIGHKPKLG